MSVPFVFVFIGIFFVCSLIAFGLKKAYYRFFKKKKLLLIPRPSTKGIASIGIILALSVSIVVLLIVVSADLLSVVFRLWSGTRIIVEGILIKIGGLLFGPLIGLCLGGAVDFLTVSLTAGVFHMGYFVSAILFGLIGGIIRTLILPGKKSQLLFCIGSSILSLLLMGLAIFFLFFFNKHKETFLISIMSLTLELTTTQIVIILVVSVVVPIIILWSLFTLYWHQKKNKKTKSNWFEIFAPVFMCIIISEIFCNNLIMPTFDEMLSPLDYSTWYAIRLLLFIPMVLVNCIIIFPVFRIIRPIIKYNYMDDIVVDIEPKNKHDKKLVPMSKHQSKKELGGKEKNVT